MIPIYVIGSSNTDMVVKAHRLPQPGETLIGGKFFLNAGGKGANQAVAAARLGGEVTFVANVGNDLFGKQTIEQLQKEKINTEFIQVDNQEPSGVALINVDAKGENTIVVAPGANGKLSSDLIRNFILKIKSPALVLVQLEIPLETVGFIGKKCSDKKIPLVLNPAPATKLSDELFSQVSFITPNESEATILTGFKIEGETSLRKAASYFHSKGVKNIIITLGERGAFWSDGKNSGFESTSKVTAVDTTAAGDCFNGALAVALAEGESISRAVAFACRAAAVSVTRLGAQTSMPYKHEL
jgi:ribokinase